MRVPHGAGVPAQQLSDGLAIEGRPAGQQLGANVLGLAIIVYLFLRELPDTLIGV